MARLPSGLYRLAKRLWMKLFPVVERLGVHIYPVHYYSQLPDTGDLRRRRAQWFRRSSMPGLSIDAGGQIEFLKDLAHPYRRECDDLPRYGDEVKRFGTGEYGEIEARIYYCFIRRFKPKRIVDVGSGISAAYALKAADAGGLDVQLTCINPSPPDGLRRLAREGRVVLIDRIVQDVDMEIFSRLEANDILFIDSTHTVKLGGDVNHLVLDVLPVLAKGVLVQFHDIPWPMPCFNSLQDLVFGQEAALVQAFLAFNSDFEILLCEWLIQMDHPEALATAFPVYDPAMHKPSALWLCRARAASR